MKILAIDPGPEESAWVVLENGVPVEFGKDKNDDVLDIIRYDTTDKNYFHLAIEMIASYGMPVGASTFETCVWIGQFIERWPYSYTKIYRKEVCMNLCQSPRAKDSNIRQAIIDRFGDDSLNSNVCKKCKGKGWFGAGRPVCPECNGDKKQPGVLYGVSNDVWAAIGVGLTYLDSQIRDNTNGQKP